MCIRDRTCTQVKRRVYEFFWKADGVTLCLVFPYTVLNIYSAHLLVSVSILSTETISFGGTACMTRKLTGNCKRLVSEVNSDKTEYMCVEGSNVKTKHLRLYGYIQRIQDQSLIHI